MHSRTARAQEQRRVRCGVLSLRGMLMLPPSRGCRRRRSAAGGRTSCCFAASRLLSRWRWAPSPSHSSAGSRTSSSRASRSTLSTSRSQPSSLEALACPGSSTDCTGQLAARSLSSPLLASPLLASPLLASPLLSSPLLSSRRPSSPLATTSALGLPRRLATGASPVAASRARGVWRCPAPLSPCPEPMPSSPLGLRVVAALGPYRSVTAWWHHVSHWLGASTLGGAAGAGGGRGGAA